MEKGNNHILKGTLWLGASAIILKVIGLIYKIPMSYILGDEGMGYFNSAYTIYTLFYIVSSAGIPKAISILTSKADEGEAKSIFLAAFKCFTLFGFILSLLLFLSARYFSSLISGKNAFFAILAISPSVFFVCSSGVIRGYLNGKLKFFPIAISELIGGLSKLFLGLLFAKIAVQNAYSLPVVCAFSIFGITVGTLLGFVYLYICYIKESRTIKKSYIAPRKVVFDILKIAFPITLASALSSLVNLIDLYIIMNGLSKSGYSEIAGAAIYGNYTTLAVPMFSVVTTLINPVALAMLPIIAKASSKKDLSSAENAFSSALWLSFFVCAPAFIIFLLFPFEALSLIFEEGSARLGFVFLSVLAPAALFYTVLTIINTTLEAFGKIRISVISLLIGAAVKSLISYFLIRYEGIGAIGAPFGTVISYFVSLVISFYALNKEKKIKISIIKPLLPSLISALVAVIPVCIFSKFAGQINSIRVKSLILLVIYGISYMTVFVLFSKKHKNIAVFLSKINKKRLD